MFKLAKSYQTSGTIGQVVFIVFLLVLSATQGVWAQTPLPPCTNSLATYTDSDSVNQNVDIDKDDDGLIEICDLEGLDAIRHQLDGTGYRTTAGATVITTGCRSGGCIGYELTRSLDFMDDVSYRAPANKATYTIDDYDDSSDMGWLPIGRSPNSFDAMFEGNGYTISNLMVNRKDTSGVGLFARTGTKAKIANIGLLDVDIRGQFQVGSLVGRNRGTIENSYAIGTVKITISSTILTFIGGLVGQNSGSISYSHAAVEVEDDAEFLDRVGGLVGWNEATIMNSYAMGSVAARNGNMGGLVGWNENTATVENSYTTGDVREVTSDPSGNDAGGLAGYNAGTIKNSYATGNTASGVFGSDVGGLIGEEQFGTISGSYWLKETGSTLPDIDNYNFGPPIGYVAGQNAEVLKSPTTANEIYGAWSTRDWDFGTSRQLPILKGMDGGSTLIPGQGVGLRDLEVFTGTSKLVLEPVLTDSERHYIVGIPSDATNVNLQLTAYNTSATIEVVKRAEVPRNDYFAGKGISGQSDPIRVNEAIETMVITVTEADGNTVAYVVSLLKEGQIAVSEDGIVDTDSIVDEGSTITLNGVFVGGSGNYRYQWAITADEPLMLSSTSTALPSFTIPGDYIKSATSTTTDIVIRLTRVDNGDLSSIETSKTITIRKKSNGAPVLDSGLIMDGLSLRFDQTRVPDADGMVIIETYQWQKRDIDEDNWSDIPAATTPGYTLTPSDRDEHGRLYRVRLEYVDAQGYDGVGYAIAIGFRADVDSDDDGLIEIYYLEHLDAIRYDLDGTHYATTAEAEGINRGCEAGVCNGYELFRSLDFDDDASYVSTSNRILWTSTGDGSGWQPIGTVLNAFNAIFEGNDHTISNLIINRDTRFIGLFGYTGSNSSITAVGLLDIDISNIAVSPDLVVGGLVGQNNGVVMGSYATGSATGGAISLRMGGLVGLNNGSVTDSHAAVNIEGMGDNVILGGLVGIDGFRSGTIENSYATGFVAGFSRLPSDLGGLIGLLRSGNSGTVTNSYATGDIGSEGPTNVGSLAGRTVRPITNSYATGSVSGTETSTVGGLIGNANSRDLISYSYWLKEAGSTLNDVGRIGNDVGSSLPYGAGRTAEQLKAPTSPGTASTATTYYNWSINDWDFGTSDQFPALKASNGNLLPGQRTGLRELAVLTAGARLLPAFTLSTNNYVLTVPSGINSIDLTLRAYSANAKVKIIAEGDDAVDYFAGKGNSGQSDPIPAETDTVLVITVTDSDDQITSYRIVLIVQGNTPLCTTFLNTYTDTDGVDQNEDIDKDGDGLIEICDLEGLYEMRYQPDGAGYKTTAGATVINTGCPSVSGCIGYELTRSLDFMDNASYRLASNKAIYTVANSDDEGWQPVGSSSDTFKAMFNGNGYTISNLMINRSGSDSNGVGLFGYTGTRAQITNLGLLTVNTTGTSSVGSLVGVNGGTIRGSYATGDITGTGDRVGGLVGSNRLGTVINSYATADVSGSSMVGGLVGLNDSAGSIINSYVIGAVAGSVMTGGVAGSNQGTIEQSYALQEAGSSISGIGSGAQLSYEIGQTAEMLKSPVEPGTTRTDVYFKWETSVWDFGTSDQFPILKTSGSDTFLLGQGIGLRQLDISTSGAKLNPTFGESTTHYVIASNMDSIVLELSAYNRDATIRIVKEADPSINYFDSTGSSGRSNPISINGRSTLIITVSEANARMTSYQVVLIQTPLPPCTVFFLNTYTDTDGVDQVMDIDKDGDGLIEICDVEGLNEMRYQMDGSGYTTSTGAMRMTDGCSSGSCTGYELTRNLDFMVNASYRTPTNKAIYTISDSDDEGWQPIGSSSDLFRTEFEGNSHTISNLMSNISDGDGVGLFGYTESGAEIAGLGLLNVDIKGNRNVGGLVGQNKATITDSYATGSVLGSGANTGGLVGLNNGATITNSYAAGDVEGVNNVGGLVGNSAPSGRIISSHAAVDVSGASQVGGLIGLTFNSNFSDVITNSYATGTVEGSGSNIGGLIGWNRVFSRIRTSYAAISVSLESGSVVGGLVGRNQDTDNIIDSYWLKETGSTLSGGSRVATDAEKTADALKSPTDNTANTGIYSNWSTRVWDFGTSDQFPALIKSDDNLLPGQGMQLDESLGVGLRESLRELEVLTPNTLLSPTFGVSTTHYVLAFLSTGDPIDIVLRLTAYNSNAKIKIATREDPTVDYFVDKGSSGESDPITIDSSTVLDITVSEDTVGAASYRIVSEQISLPQCTLSLRLDDDNDGIPQALDVDKNGNGLIEICDLEGLDEMRHQTDGAGYKAGADISAITSGCPVDGCTGYELTRSLDFGNNASYRTTSNKAVYTITTPTDVGWEPIGSSADTFKTKFEGNDHTISNLMINRSGSDGIGLFAYTGTEAEIANLGLLGVNTAGNDDVGGLVGNNKGMIVGSHAEGSVSGNGRIGGLVGDNEGAVMDSYAAGVALGSDNSIGGLVGRNTGSDSRIMTSYATGTVEGSGHTKGGLVGWNTSGGFIMDSYATGNVTGTGNRVGGLVGQNDSGSSITTSYAIGNVAGSNTVGGLAGVNQGTITHSYWRQVSGSGLDSIGTDPQLLYRAGRTERRLKLPMANIGIYSNWSPDVWDFGTADQFPILKASDGTLLPNQGMNIRAGLRESLRELKVLTPGTQLIPTFGISTAHYVMSFFPDTGDTLDIVLELKAYNPNARIRLTNREDGIGGSNYFAGRGSSGRSDAITIREGTVLDITVVGTNTTTSYTVLARQISLPRCTVNFPDDNDGVGADSDVDRDNDGLIEICDLEGLDAMRYQIDGTGYRASTNVSAVTIGCPSIGGCKGYELARSLDFMDNASYRTTSNKAIYTVADYSDSDDEGWQPIGSSSDTFKAMFNGNGYTISNLMINRGGSDGNGVGLFGYTGTGAQITNLGLLNVNTTGTSSVGGLVGVNGGTIRDSYATGDITGTDDRVGGLVGSNTLGTVASSYVAGSVSGVNRVGGLVGSNDDDSSIMASYAMVEVEGSGNAIGGLSGANSGDISDSYVAAETSSVSGSSRVGGLVGRNAPAGTITNGYTLAAVSGDSLVGGLIGQNASGSIIAQSYWTRETSSSLSGIGEGQQLSYQATQTAVALKLPTTNTGIYSNWRALLWDFGTSDQFPILKVSGGNLLPGQGVGLRTLKVPTLATELSPVFGDSTTNYVITFFYANSSTQNIVLELTAYDSDATIELIKAGENIDYFADKGSSSRSDVILVDSNTVLNITVREANLDTTSYRIEVVAQQVVLPPCVASLASALPDDNDGISDELDIDKDNDGLIEICDVEGLDEMRYQLDGTGYTVSADAVKIATGCPVGGCIGYELTRSLDFMDAGSYRLASSSPTYTVSNYNDSDDEGWEPIGAFPFSPFRATFDGNGYTISNLMINRKNADRIGLFGHIQIGGTKIANLGVLNVNIMGGYSTGGLVGANSGGTVINSYATGHVEGSDTDIGGLVGINVGTDASITNSYAAVSVVGPGNAVDYMGGLTAQNDGMITNSYATGSVEGGDRRGGLVGQNNFSRFILGSIRNSYATGLVAGSGSNVGGLVGWNIDDAEINHSYWLSGSASSGGNNVPANTSRTVMQFTSPTTPTMMIYTSWSTDDWDFGTSNQFPALKYAEECVKPEITTIKSIAGQPICGTLLPHQGMNIGDRDSGLRESLRELEIANINLVPTFGVSTNNYVVQLFLPRGMTTRSIVLRLKAYNPDAMIQIFIDGDFSTDYFEGKRSGDESLPIIVGANTKLIIRVSEPDTDYTITFAVEEPPAPESIRLRIKVFLEGPLQ